MIVVDTNIIAYLFITGERSGQAERVLLKMPNGLRRSCGAANFAMS